MVARLDALTGRGRGRNPVLVAWVGRVLDVTRILTQRLCNFHRSVSGLIVVGRGAQVNFRRRAELQLEGKDACYRASWRGGVGRRIRGCVQGLPGALIQIKSELEPSCLTARILEQSGGPGGVGPNTGGPALANLHASGRELDESLEQIRGRSTATVRMPERFPAFVGLPVVSRVEQRDSLQVRGRRLPLICQDRINGPMLAPPRMPVRRVSRVWPGATGHVGVGRKWQPTGHAIAPSCYSEDSVTNLILWVSSGRVHGSSTDRSDQRRRLDSATAHAGAPPWGTGSSRLVVPHGGNRPSRDLHGSGDPADRKGSRRAWHRGQRLAVPGDG